MYDKFYGYSALPFRLSPDPTFFYGSKGHRRALAYLRYGLQQREGFIVITGNPGTGKTTIARALLLEIGKDKIVVGELNNTHLQADDVLRMVAASFGLEHENLPKASLLKRLETFFLSKYRAGYHCLLLIDEAQNLPFESLEELRMLSNFYQGKHALLQIFLMGQQQFRDVLYSPELEQLRQRVVAATHLDPLDEVEARDYIIHRLKRVGWRGTNPAFSKRAFAHIYTLTKGIPRRINTFCDRLLLYASIEERTVINDAIVRAVARELIFEVSHRSQAVSPAQDEVLKDVNDVDSELDSSAVSDAEMVSPDDISKEYKEEEPSSSNEGSSRSQSVTNSSPTPSSSTASFSNNGGTAIQPAIGNTPRPPQERANNLRLVATSEQAALAQQIEPDYVVPPMPEVAEEEVISALSKTLEFYRNPDRFPEWPSSSSRLPKGSMALIQVALGKWFPKKEQLAKLSVTNPDELREAARYFIRNVWLSTTSDYYRRLGLDQNATDEQLRDHYRALFRLFQPDNVLKGEAWDKTWAQKINQAYSILRDAGKRKAYDQFLQNLQNANTGPTIGDTRQHTVVVRNDSMPTQIGDVFLEQDVFAQSEISVEHEKDLDQINGSGHSHGGKRSKRVVLIAILVLLGLAAAGGAYFYSEQIKNMLPKNETQKTDVQGDATAVESFDLPKHSETTLDTTPSKSEPVEREEPSFIDRLVNTEPIKEEPKPETEVAKSTKKSTKAESTVNETKTSVIPKEEQVASIQVPPPPTVKPEPKPVAEDATALSASTRTKSSDTIQQPDLTALINRFSLAYEEADIDTLMGLFSAEAITNDSQNKADIRKDYLNLFKSSDMRVIDINNLRWKINQNKATGQGDFKVTVLRKGGKDMRSFVGSIQFTVEKNSNTNLAIKEIYHAYSMDERQ